MASKKSGRKNTRVKTGRPPEVLELSKKARKEVARLLRRSRAGTITNARLQTGLKEVKAQLGKMASFIWDFRNWS
jgi:hypothetical protein